MAVYPSSPLLNGPTQGVLSTSTSLVFDSSIVLYSAGSAYATGAWRAVTPSDSIQVVSTPNNTTISGVEGQMITGITLQANVNRTQTYIQNLGSTGPLAVLFGTGAASAQNCSMMLKADTATYAGGGGVWNWNGFYQGSISVSGRGPFIAWQA